jgi:hypothetical protein
MDKENILDSMNEEQIKNMIVLLQTMLSSKSVEDKKPESTAEVKKPEKKKKTNKQNVSDKKNKPKNKYGYQSSPDDNKFLSMSEANMHKDDARIDALLCKHPPVARSRTFEYVDVKCRLCGREEKVSPGILTDSPSRYKCNKCSAIQG